MVLECPPQPGVGGLRVALAHDYLTQRGGAERVVLSLAKVFPGAPVYTSVYNASDTFPELADLRVSSTWLNRFGVIRRNHRLGLLLYAPAFATFSIKDADVVVCSTSGWAHGIRTEAPKIAYCHTPARWLYGRNDAFVPHAGVTASALRVVSSVLKVWDRRAAESVRGYVANSVFTQRRIRSAYGIDAEVVYPASGLPVDGAVSPIEGVEPGFVLHLGRLLPYKNVGCAVEAFKRRQDDRLLVVGGGPLLEELKSAATPNVHFAGESTDAQVRWAFQNARAVLSLSYEDFGLVPVEAASMGKPVVALHWGGYLESVVEGVTGVFVDRLDAGMVAAAVDEVDRTRWEPEVLRDHARTFSAERFADQMRAVVKRAVD